MRISDWSSDACSSDLQAEMDRISASREASQPLRSKTGGSTFKNPEGRKAWQLVDAAGCRGLMVGGAQEIGRASCRARACQYVRYAVGAVSLNKQTQEA